MKLLTHNWQAKIGSLILALFLWVALKEKIEPGFINQLADGTALRAE